jgi:exodeoxyribonuclease-1
MAGSFFFYDLETSGIDPRNARIMQFAGQRTDMNLNLIGDPVNYLIKMTADVLPVPDAVLITGITPQHTVSEGIIEPEFLKLFYSEVVTQDTIFVGYNSIRFDDEFMRFLNYRNFYDAYEWQWKNGCSRWDLLDVVRMTRALRPEGILWPFDSAGKATNRLELLTSINKLSHMHAHDALSDVLATIDLARLIKIKQPELFNYLLNSRSKQAVKQLVQKATPFVYTSGRFSSKFAHTTVAVQLAKHNTQDAALVYDLRYDPAPFLKMNVESLIEAWKYHKDPEAVRLPVKTLKYNRCPAIAPLGVIKDKATQERLDLDLINVTRHLEALKQNQSAFTQKLAEAVSIMDKEREKQQMTTIDNELTVDERLYDGFIDKVDQTVMSEVRTMEPRRISDLNNRFKDDRLKKLLPLYKARNYRSLLDSEEVANWESFIAARLFSGDNNSQLSRYFKRLDELSKTKLTKEQDYLISELRLYGESLMPADLT